MSRHCAICSQPQYCDCLCPTCAAARETLGQTDSIEVVDEDGLAHGYTEADDELHDEQEVICNKCSHTFIITIDPPWEGICPNCGESDYATE